MAEKKLIISIEADTSNADQSLKNLDGELQNLSQSATDLSSSFESTTTEIKTTAAEISSLNEKIQTAPQVPEGTQGSVKSLKQQFKEARLELERVTAEFGNTSPQAAKAAANVASIKDKMGDLKGLTDAFNPDAKFKGFANAIQGATGALTAVTGAQALFGSKSEEVAQVLANVQGAMAFSQGINQVMESKDAIKALGTQLMSLNVVQKIVTGAQWLWNAAMAANPIGAIVAAVAALIGGIVALTSWLKSSAAEAKAQAKAVDESAKALDRQSKALERGNFEFERRQAHELAMAKASGKSAEAIRTLELKLADEKIAYEKSARATAYSTYEKEKNYLATLKASGADDEVIKKQTETVKKAVELVNSQNKNVQSALDEKVSIQRRHEVEIAQVKTDAAKKDKEDAKKNAEDAKKNNQEALDIIAQARRSMMTAQQQEEYDVIKKFEDDKKKLIEAGITDYSDLENQKNKQLSDIAEKYQKEQLAKISEYENHTFELRTKQRLEGIPNLFQREREQVELEYQKNVDEALKILDDQSIKVEDRERIYNERRLIIDKEYLDKKIKITEDQGLYIANIEEQLFQENEKRRIDRIKNQYDKEQEAIAKNYQDQIDKAVKFLDDKNLSEADRQKYYNQAKAEADKEYQEKTQANEFARQEAIIAKTIENDQIAYEQKKTALDNELLLLEDAKNKKIISDEQYTAALKKNAETRVKVDEIERDKKKAIRLAIAGTLTQFSDLVGKQTKAGKAAAITGLLIEKAQSTASIITSTRDAVMKSYKQSPTTFGLPWSAISLAQGVLSLAQTVKATKQGIQDIQNANAGTSGGDASMGTAAAAGGAAPVPAGPEQTILPQAQIDQIASANAATRAYVVESDVTSNQERITRLNRAARIG